MKKKFFHILLRVLSLIYLSMSSNCWSTWTLEQTYDLRFLQRERHQRRVSGISRWDADDFCFRLADADFV